VNTVMNLAVPQKAGNFLTSWVSFSIRRRTLSWSWLIVLKCQTHMILRVLRLSRRWWFMSRSFWVVTPYSVAVGYQRFGQPWRWRQPSRLKRWYPTTSLHSVATQKDLDLKIWISTKKCGRVIT
jgi:hypothetical protein